ncbi:MAG: hypothetical protein KGL39_29460 [Patescibacteria group bacterium]|nr:hypothetical protein [Patescibacteria group bacterium]
MNDVPEMLGPYYFGYSAYRFDGDHDVTNPHIPGTKDYEAFKTGWQKAEREWLEKDHDEF